METARACRAARSETAAACFQLDGSPLTERLKLAIATAFVAHDASADEFVVSHGAAGRDQPPHGREDPGAGEPVVIDLAKDNASACSPT